MTIDERMERLEVRLAALARSANRWRMACALLAGAIVAGGVLGLAAVTPEAEVVRAKRFEVLNDSGQVVMFLDTWLEGGWVHSTNAGGATVFSARADQEGRGSLGVFDENGQRMVDLGASEGGEGRVVTKDRRGRSLVGLSGAVSGGVVEVYGITGAAAAAVRVNLTGGGEFVKRSLGGEWEVIGQAAPSQQHAQGTAADLIAKEGESVTYAIRTVRIGRDGPDRVTEGEYVITMLEGVKSEQGAAHWLEVSRPSWRGEQTLYRVLVLDEHLTGKVNPFEHVVQGFEKTADGDVREFDERLMGFAARILPAAPWLGTLSGEGVEKVSIEGKTIDALVKQGTQRTESPDGNYVSEASGRVWVSEAVPFGLVKAEVGLDFNWGNRDGRTETVVELKKVQTGVGSRLFEE